MWQPYPCKKKKATICSLIWNIVYYQCTFLNNERCWKINPARLLFVPYFTLSLSWNVNKTKRVATNRGGVRGVSYCVTRARGLFQMKLVYLLQIYEYLRQQLYYLFKKNSCDSTMWVFFQFLPNFLGFTQCNVNHAQQAVHLNWIFILKRIYVNLSETSRFLFKVKCCKICPSCRPEKKFG